MKFILPESRVYPQEQSGVTEEAAVDPSVVRDGFINVLVGVGLPALLWFFRITDVASSIGIGIMIWVALTLGRVYAHVVKISRNKRREDIIWKTSSDFERKLVEVRDAMPRIVQEENDEGKLFERHFNEFLADYTKNTLLGKQPSIRCYRDSIYEAGKFRCQKQR
jgi:hypothetical protein